MPHSYLYNPDVAEILAGDFIRSAIYTFFYGVCVLLYGRSIAVHGQRKQRSSAQKWMFWISTSSFLLSTIIEGCTIATNCFSILYVIDWTPDLTTTQASLDLEFGMEWLPTLIPWLEIALILTTDVVVIWRAVVLIRDRRRKLIAMTVTSLLVIIFILISITSAINSVSINSKLVTTIDYAPIGVQILFSVSRYLISLMINLVATTIIAWVYWIHRKDMALGFQNHPSTKAEKVLVLLIESGVVFCVLQIMNIASYNLEGDINNLQEIIWTFYIGFVSVYPAAVVALVDTKNTLDEMYSINTSLELGVSAGRDRRHIESIRFAPSGNPTSQTTIAEGGEDVSN